MIYDPTAVNYVMNTVQAASYLGVPKDVIDDLVAKRSIPFTKVGDRIVFSKAALDYWVYAKSMESLQEDLPNLGFQGRKAV
ncbi:MAG: helix-turn-helix domain-containing protein [Chloroflexi bacterium]|nr:MAG: helix-turn-helix domain-containing protein [Chloroflexota bacterium]